MLALVCLKTSNAIRIHIIFTITRAECLCLLSPHCCNPCALYIRFCCCFVFHLFRYFFYVFFSSLILLLLLAVVLPGCSRRAYVYQHHHQHTEELIVELSAHTDVEQKDNMLAILHCSKIVVIVASV